MIDMARQHDSDRKTARFKEFQTTHWSLILAARDGDSTGADEALAELCGAYWFPLYAFVRRKGYDPETARDLVQGFVARMLEKRDLLAVDPGKGKFRSFLMASCSHYLANQRDQARAQKRGGRLATISFDGLDAESRYGCEPADALTAERLFEKQWALALLDRVMVRLEAEMTQAGKSRQFAALKPALLGGALRAPFAQIAAELTLSEDAARAAAHRLRRRYRSLLRDEVARTVDDPADIEDEITALFVALGH
jgi:DNA-directed RNA polymerase specialized sigma24 family protein